MAKHTQTHTHINVLTSQLLVSAGHVDSAFSSISLILAYRCNSDLSGELDKFPWLTWFPSHVYLWILVCLCHTVVSMSPHWLHPTYRGQGMSSQCPHFTHSHTQTKEHFTSTSVPPLLPTHSHLWHLADALIQNNRLHFYIQSIYITGYLPKQSRLGTSAQGHNSSAPPENWTYDLGAAGLVPKPLR